MVGLVFGCGFFGEGVGCIFVHVLVYFSGPKRHVYDIPSRLFWNKLPYFHYLYNSLLYTKHTTIFHSILSSTKKPLTPSQDFLSKTLNFAGFSTAIC